MRAKNAENSPYQSGDTDSREFPDTDGEVLPADKFIALADDIAAIMERLVDVEGAAGPGAVGDFDFVSAGNIALTGPGSPDVAAAVCHWSRSAKTVLANITIEFSPGTADTCTGIDIGVPDLIALGLPEPATLLGGSNLVDVLLDDAPGAQFAARGMNTMAITIALASAQDLTVVRIQAKYIAA